MVFVNCSVEETTKKYVDEMGMAYEKNEINPRVHGVYPTLGNVNLRISFNNDEKQKIIPTEFIV
ncbi:hypothetical protein RhiirC2_761686, partial [Rhizophagus irregularis]